MSLFRFATKTFSVALVILSLTVTATAQRNVELKKQATARDTKAHGNLAFVTEYVRELSASETIRASAEQVLTQGTNDDKFYNCVYSSTRMQLELRTQINILKGMHLPPPVRESHSKPYAILREKSRIISETNRHQQRLY